MRAEEKKKPMFKGPVTLRFERAGIKRCGQYRAGVDYLIEDAAEAERLVTSKGFVVVDQAAAQAG